MRCVAFVALAMLLVSLLLALALARWRAGGCGRGCGCGCGREGRCGWCGCEDACAQELAELLGFPISDDDGAASGGGGKRRSVLALDLDETLVHSRGDLSSALLRPHAREFLRAAAGLFDELAVFTAGTRPYAEPIVDRLAAEAGVRIARRLYRDSCTPVIAAERGELGYAKDLRLLGHPGADVTLLDNTPGAYALQPHRGVPIASFYDDPDDRALLDVLPALAARALDDAAALTQTRAACAARASTA
jgi:hypothetical protein